MDAETRVGGGVGVAVLGVGHVHMGDLARALQERPGVKVAAVWDDHPQLARRWADELGTDVTASPEAALAVHGVDGVLAYGRPSGHRRIVEATARRGLPVFVEKPLAVSPDDVDVLARLGHVPAPFSTGFFLRYSDAFVALRLAVTDGAIGPVEHVVVRVVHDGLARGWFDGEHAWMGDPAEGGGGFFDLAVHGLDLVRWLVGGDLVPDTVTLTPSAHHGTATLRTTSGTAIELEAGWETTEPVIEMHVSGPGGSLVAADGQLHHDGKVVLSGSSPDAAAGPAAWLDVLTDESRDSLVPYADAITNARHILALRRTAAAT